MALSPICMDLVPSFKSNHILKGTKSSVFKFSSSGAKFPGKYPTPGRHVRKNSNLFPNPEIFQMEFFVFFLKSSKTTSLFWKTPSTSWEFPGNIPTLGELGDKTLASSRSVYGGRCERHIICKFSVVTAKC